MRRTCTPCSPILSSVLTTLPCNFCPLHRRSSAGIPENRYKQRVFVLACTFTVFVLVVFFTSLFLQYETLRKTTFISVEESDGCKPVLATINDQFRFDQKGYWDVIALWTFDAWCAVDFLFIQLSMNRFFEDSAAGDVGQDIFDLLFHGSISP